MQAQKKQANMAKVKTNQNNKKKLIVLHRKSSNKLVIPNLKQQLQIDVPKQMNVKRKQAQQSNIMTARFHNSLQIVDDDLKSRHLYLLQTQNEDSKDQIQYKHHQKSETYINTQISQNCHPILTLLNHYTQNSINKSQFSEQNHKNHHNSLMSFDSKALMKKKSSNKIGVINLNLITSRRSSLNRKIQINKVQKGEDSLCKQNLESKSILQTKSCLDLVLTNRKQNIIHINQPKKSNIALSHFHLQLNFKNNREQQQNRAPKSTSTDCRVIMRQVQGDGVKKETNRNFIKTLRIKSEKYSVQKVNLIKTPAKKQRKIKHKTIKFLKNQDIKQLL